MIKEEKFIVPKFTLEYLRTVLHYDPNSGVFTWLKSHHKSKVGKTAGYVAGGYLRITVATEKTQAHRLAWFYMKGEWPEGILDHRDNNPLNNVFKNLRRATRSQNKMNSRPMSDHLKGVTRYTRDPTRWCAYICKDYKKRYLGIFDTEEAAHERYAEEAERVFGPEWARMQ